MKNFLVITNNGNTDYESVFGLVDIITGTYYDANELECRTKQEEDTVIHEMCRGEHHVATVTEYTNSHGRHVRTVVTPTGISSIVSRVDPNAYTQSGDFQDRKNAQQLAWNIEDARNGEYNDSCPHCGLNAVLH